MDRISENRELAEIRTVLRLEVLAGRVVERFAAKTLIPANVISMESSAETCGIARPRAYLIPAGVVEHDGEAKLVRLAERHALLELQIHREIARCRQLQE